MLPFELPNMADQLVTRFLDAGHGEALSTLLEVMEAELGERPTSLQAALARRQASARLDLRALKDSACPASSPTSSARSRQDLTGPRSLRRWNHSLTAA